MKRKKLQWEDCGKTLLIDGDIILWRVGATTNDESEDTAKLRMNSYLDELLQQSFCTNYRIFLTDKDNFRLKIYPPYKGNRTQEKPKHYKALRDYLISYEKAEVAFESEADDYLSIYQTDKTILASDDKDLKQVPGLHFNLRTRIHTEVTNKQARHSFWMQMLTGDATDNIPGIKGIGPKKAEKILDGCVSTRDYHVAVCAAYEDLTDVPCVLSHLDMIGKLLWIRRKPNEMWSVYG